MTAEEIKAWEAIKAAIAKGKKVQVEGGKEGIKMVSFEPKSIKLHISPV